MTTKAAKGKSGKAAAAKGVETTSRRQNNQLPNNLPQLQNLIKRDPESYNEEFQQQLRHFEATKAVFELSPSDYNQSLDELVMFMAQVAKCYSRELAAYPQTLIDLLKKHSTVLNADMRLSFCRALILLRHKGLLAPADLLQLFFDLLRCQDKSLRKFLKDHIVSDLKNVNAKHKDVRLNTVMQNFMFTMLKDAHAVAAKTSLDVMIELYKKNVWKDAKTVNVISTACFSETTKLMVTAVKFFLGSDEDEDDDDDDDKDEFSAVKEVKLANKVNRKTKKAAAVSGERPTCPQKEAAQREVGPDGLQLQRLAPGPRPPGFRRKTVQENGRLEGEVRGQAPVSGPHFEADRHPPVVPAQLLPVHLPVPQPAPT